MEQTSLNERGHVVGPVVETKGPVVETRGPVVETKGQLEKIIREWLSIDKQSREMKKHLEIVKKEQKQKSAELIEIMKHHDLHGFNINGGKIKYIKQTIKKPLSNKMILSLLEDFFEGEEDKAMALNQYLQENREIAVRENVVHKPNKDTVQSSNV